MASRRADRLDTVGIHHAGVFQVILSWCSHPCQNLALDKHPCSHQLDSRLAGKDIIFNCLFFQQHVQA
jgi:hypothetical protein